MSRRLLGCALGIPLAWLAAGDPVASASATSPATGATVELAIQRLRTDQAMPGPAGERFEAERLSDGAVIAMTAGQPAADLQPGAYLVRAGGGLLLLLRSDDSLPARARAYAGLPLVNLRNAKEAELASQRALGFNAVSLPIAVWREADGWPWPWLADPGYWDGLAGVCRRLNPDRNGCAFSAPIGAYADAAGKPLRIGTDGDGLRVDLGDLVAADGRMGLLVADRGKPGQLDPADEVVTASPREGQPHQVRVERIGNLLGDNPVHLFVRDRAGAERLIDPKDRGQALHRDWVQMAPWQRAMLLGGVLVLALILIRFQWRMRRRLRQRYGDPR